MITVRLDARVRRDFPDSSESQAVRAILDELIADLGPDGESERIPAAVLVLADGDSNRFLEAVALARLDWRDVLVASGLADADWADRLDAELEPR
ncbi:MAG TPA: hypothetical protein VGJ28_24015 [Micromonosporaceae bacterium]